MGREEPQLGREEPQKMNTACKLLSLASLGNWQCPCSAMYNSHRGLRPSPAQVTQALVTACAGPTQWQGTVTGYHI